MHTANGSEFYVDSYRIELYKPIQAPMRFIIYNSKGKIIARGTGGGKTHIETFCRKFLSCYVPPEKENAA